MDRFAVTMRVMNSRRRLISAGLTIALSALAQSPKVDLAGSISSIAPVTIDGTKMNPAAAPVFPVQKNSTVVISSAPALLTTPEKNRLTFEHDSRFRLGSEAGSQTYVFLESGAAGFEAFGGRVSICAAGRLFVPPTPSKGYVRLTPKNNAVTRFIEKGAFLEDGRRACNEKGILSALPGVAAGGVGAGAVAAGSAAGGVISGTAAGTAAGLGTFGVSAIAAGGAAAGVATVSSFAAAGSIRNCTDPAGCNFNPVPVSASSPQ